MKKTIKSIFRHIKLSYTFLFKNRPISSPSKSPFKNRVNDKTENNISNNVVSLKKFRARKNKNVLISVVEIPDSAPIMRTPFFYTELKFVELIIMPKNGGYSFNYTICAVKPKPRTAISEDEIHNLEKISRSQLNEELAWLGQKKI